MLKSYVIAFSWKQRKTRLKATESLYRINVTRRAWHTQMTDCKDIDIFENKLFLGLTIVNPHCKKLKNLKQKKTKKYSLRSETKVSFFGNEVARINPCICASIATID